MEHLPPEILNSVNQILPTDKWLGFPLIVAVSGGPDSVALLRILLQIKSLQQRADSPLIVAHFNHGLRGAEADADELFVRQLALEHHLEFRCERNKAPLPTDSEESLREKRYQFLTQIAQESGARYIATGHTLDDQVETILFRIIRGTGIGGLAGVRPIRVVAQTISIVRPLLSMTREAIEAYLTVLGQDYRNDLSNTNTRYSRNYLRHEILPLIRQRFGICDRRGNHTFVEPIPGVSNPVGPAYGRNG